jgi:two-component system response regulator NreC
MAITVLVADDHKIIREGLRRMIENEDDMVLLGEAEDGRTIVRLARKLTPDVIIMDVCMPNMNGIVATRLIRSEFPKIKVIALSMYDDSRFVLNMLKVGASGYLVKDCSFTELAQAIRTVVANKAYISPRIAHVLVSDYFMANSSRESWAYYPLSLREAEVLQLIAEGKSSHQIADSLHISIKTIETHRQKIFQKLNLKSIAELTKYAIREGLTAA